eukprot:2504578-Lingulodinium_polyedra.AAC.1
MQLACMLRQRPPRPQSLRGRGAATLGHQPRQAVSWNWRLLSRRTDAGKEWSERGITLWAFKQVSRHQGPVSEWGQPGTSGLGSVARGSSP